MLKWIRNLAIVVVATFVLGEIVLRIYNPIYVPLRADQIELPVNRTFTMTNADRTDIDQDVVNHYNGIGLRGPEFPADPEHYVKVITVGGSTTACVTLTDGKTWPDRLAQLLAKDVGPKVWLNNAGFDGHSTFGHSVLLKSHLVKFKPQYVTFLVGINELGRDDLTDFDKTMLKDGQSFRNRVVSASELLSTIQVLRRTWMAYDFGLNHRAKTDMRVLPKMQIAADKAETFLRDQRDKYVPGYGRRLENLVTITRGMGAEPVFITQPSMMGRGVDAATGERLDDIEYEPLHIPSWLVGEGLEMYNAELRRVAAEQHVLLIDAAREMPKDSSLYFDWVHYSNVGAERMGAMVAAQLEPLLSAKVATLAP